MAEIKLTGEQKEALAVKYIQDFADHTGVTLEAGKVDAMIKTQVMALSNGPAAPAVVQPVVDNAALAEILKGLPWAELAKKTEDSTGNEHESRS